jgi:solute carrier family 25 phosphate transporter 3
MTLDCQANILHSVKTRIQLDPVTYNNGLIGGFRKVIANEGAGAVWTGFGPTAAGYFLQGAFKFGGYELFKQQAINLVGYESASNNRTAVYLASAACPVPARGYPYPSRL